MNETIFIVISKDNGVILATRNINKAKEAVKTQEANEEFQGGRPSVYIKPTTLI